MAIKIDKEDFKLKPVDVLEVTYECIKSFPGFDKGDIRSDDEFDELGFCPADHPRFFKRIEKLVKKYISKASIREDLTSITTSISPVNTPFFNSIRKSEFKWPENKA